MTLLMGSFFESRDRDHSFDVRTFYFSVINEILLKIKSTREFNRINTKVIPSFRGNT